MTMGKLRTVTQLGLAGILAAAMMLAFAAVGGVGVGFAHGGGNGHGQGQTHAAAGASNAQATQATHTNHGYTVSQVAHSTCTATVPANPSVSNHGQCVRLAAQGQTQTTTQTTTDTSTGAAGVQSAQAGTHHTKNTHVKHHAKKTHVKHHAKKHHAKR